LSTGVSLIANSLTKESELMIALIPGIICVLFVAICYVKEYLGYSSYEVNVNSVISVDDKKCVVPIERFEFSEDLQRAVISVLSENKAYIALWEDAFVWDIAEGKKGKSFVKEFIDYLFVDWISLELNSYFTDFEEGETEIIGREQIPDVLIKNRVIELITKPYEEREKFQKTMSKKDPVEGRIVYAEGEDEVVFDMLEIELPRKSKIFREGNSLVIRNRNFDIKFESEFEGDGAVLARYFENFYMNRSIRNTHNYSVTLKLTINLKPFFLLSIRDWKYLGWLDRIGDSFVKYFSYDEFLKRIGYEQAVTNHILFMTELERKKVDDDCKYEDFRIVKVERDKDATE
jgi:hypothetical protein